MFVLNIKVIVKFKKFLKSNNEGTEMGSIAEQNNEKFKTENTANKNIRQTERKLVNLTFILNVIFSLSRLLESIEIIIVQLLPSTNPAIYYMESIYITQVILCSNYNIIYKLYISIYSKLHRI